ncbi:MAG: Uma2 family endonuclease, partial [Treponema sp.]|nr:Uma2 family endonuclease [Treponema sp.]
MAYAQNLHEERSPIFRRENIPAKGYTYKDYLSWGEDVRCELIDGIPHMLAAPSEWHQWVVGKVFRQIDTF